MPVVRKQRGISTEKGLQWSGSSTEEEHMSLSSQPSKEGDAREKWPCKPGFEHGEGNT